MKSATALLNEIKAKYGLETDYALAKQLKLHRQDVSRYYAGTQSPNEYACLQIAKALGKSYEEVSAIVRIEAEKDEKRRAAWKEYYKSIGGYAASFMMMATFVTLIVTWPIDATAKSMGYDMQETRKTNYAFIRRIFKTAIEAAKRTFSTLFPNACFAD